MLGAPAIHFAYDLAESCALVRFRLVPLRAYGPNTPNLHRSCRTREGRTSHTRASSLRLHWRYLGDRGRSMSNSADAVQPGFSEPFANAFWSWEAAVPNETKLSPYGVGDAEGRQRWNFAGEFECASLGSFAYVGAAPAFNRTV